MAILKKVDSNVTGFSYAEETSLGVLPGTPTWYPLEPNSYSDLGGDFKLLARNPINTGRQRQKGVLVDLDAAGGLNNDFTLNENMVRLLQGFFFADIRDKGTVNTITSVATSDDSYNKLNAFGTYKVADLVFASGFANAANNGLKNVTALVTTDDGITVSQNLVDETPAATAQVIRVGHQFAATDLSVDATVSDLPQLKSAAFDLTTLGLVAGEWVYIGDDSNAAYSFATAANNGWARVKTIATGALTLDKTSGTMVDDAGTGKTVRIFFGRVLKNEMGTSIVRRTYSLERKLGSPDDAQPTKVQAEYLDGAVANELTINFKTADKMNMDLSFIAIDDVQVTQTTDIRTGTRPTNVALDAFNSSNDFARLKMSILDPIDSNPTALFGYLKDFTITINNNASPNKAISVLGAFEVTVGQFNVDGKATAYFSQVEAIQAIRNNSDVTFDFALAKNNTGLVMDLPLIALGGGKLNVEQDKEIDLPLDMPAAEDRNFHHTALMNFFAYLPDVAMPQ